MDSSNNAKIMCTHSREDFLEAEKKARGRGPSGTILKKDWPDLILYGEVLLECLEDENVVKPNDLKNYKILLSDYIKGKVPNPNIPALFRKLPKNNPFKISDEVRDNVYRVGLERATSILEQVTRTSAPKKSHKKKRKTNCLGNSCGSRGSRVAQMKARLNKNKRRKKTGKKKKH